jgi:hypothetical protein
MVSCVEVALKYSGSSALASDAGQLVVPTNVFPAIANVAVLRASVCSVMAPAVITVCVTTLYVDPVTTTVDCTVSEAPEVSQSVVDPYSVSEVR